MRREEEEEKRGEKRGREWQWAEWGGEGKRRKRGRREDKGIGRREEGRKREE